MRYEMNFKNFKLLIYRTTLEDLPKVMKVAY